MGDDGPPEVTPLPGGGDARRRLGAELAALAGFDPADEETRARWVNDVLVSAHRRGVAPAVIVAELRTKLRGRPKGFPPVNSGIVDRWTVAHFVSGYGLGLLGASWPQAVAAGTAFELVERYAKEAKPEAFPHPSPDSAANTAGDLVAIGLGCWLAGG